MKIKEKTTVYGGRPVNTKTRMGYELPAPKPKKTRKLGS